MKATARQKITHLTFKFTLGLATLIVGLICAGIVMFQTTGSLDAQSSFDALNRYVLGLTSFIAIIFGSMLCNDAWVLRGVWRGKYERLSYDSILKAYQALYSVYLSKSKSRGGIEEDDES